MKFFSFWRSLASFRVRIALNLKNLPAEVVFVDLDADAHRTDEYRRINPQMALPALVEDDGTTLFQSLAILEYLEETHPSPADPARRRQGPRAGAGAGADGGLRGPSAAGAAGAALSRPRAQSARRAADRLAAALDHRDADGAGRPSRRPQGHRKILPWRYADAWPTSAWSAIARSPSCCRSSLDRWPTVKRIFETAMALPEFAKAHPLAQPDTPEAMRPKAG